MNNIIEKTINVFLASALKPIFEEFKQITVNKKLEFNVEEYSRNYYTKTILHRSHPVKLSDVYFPLTLHRNDVDKLEGIKKIHLRIDKVSDLFSKSSFITIVGTAGSGKSTLLKYLLIKSIEDDYLIPIKVELRYLNDYEGGLEHFIYDKIFRNYRLAANQCIFQRILDSGKVIFLFDGYDEVSSAKKEVITYEIEAFTKKYSKNNFVLTSRPYSGIEMLPSFHNYYINDLSLNEVKEFIDLQIPNSEKEVAEKIWKSICEDDDKETMIEFLKNPLLLSMFILSYQSYAEVPNQKSIFYSQVFDTLYSIHDSVSKMAFVREKKAGISKYEYLEILEIFSFVSYFKDVFLFSQDYIDDSLKMIKTAKGMSFNPEYFIEDLKIAIGLLIREGIYYTFPHRSLQEYFCARYICNLNTNSRSTLLEHLKEKLINEKFQVSKHYNLLSLLTEMNFSEVTQVFIIDYIDLLNTEISKFICEEKSIDDVIKLLSAHESYSEFLYDYGNGRFNQYKWKSTSEAELKSYKNNFQFYKDFFGSTIVRLNEKSGKKDLQSNLKTLRASVNNSLSDIKVNLEKLREELSTILRNHDNFNNELINAVL